MELKFGIVSSIETPVTGASLIKKAQIALDKGHLDQAGINFYTPEFEKQTKFAYEIAGSLKEAIVNDEFYLVYQPIIDIKTNEISSAEVLLRWDRQGREPVGPATFVAIAEKIGLIGELSKWVARHNLDNVIGFQNQGIDLVTSINLTGDEILDDNFRSWGHDLVVNSPVPCCQIAIEITERMFARDEERMNEILVLLKENGYQIYIDDFGTGYNSLKAIGKFPVDAIKIDKYFIDRYEQPKMKVVIEHLITASHKISNQVVAEGVETASQVEFLKELGCDKIQGYYYSKPLEPKEFVTYYREFYRNIWENKEN